MEPQAFQTLLQFLKVLAHESRLKMLGLLADRQYSVGELAELRARRAQHRARLPAAHDAARLPRVLLVAPASGSTHVHHHLRGFGPGGVPCRGT